MRFFRLARAGWRCAAASHFTFFKGKILYLFNDKKLYRHQFGVPSASSRFRPFLTTPPPTTSVAMTPSMYRKLSPPPRKPNMAERMEQTMHIRAATRQKAVDKPTT